MNVQKTHKGIIRYKGADPCFYDCKVKYIYVPEKTNKVDLFLLSVKYRITL